ncbi:MAG TPA: alpha/beta fold hydrolase [Pyrinomonadaceae bacterium]|nr:alpha/beta fold hydrolase [Pyrinomonadaceae bacterium]
MRLRLIIIGAVVAILAASALAQKEIDKAAPLLVSFATDDGGTIYGDLYGNGRHGVVLVHGGRFNKESWAKQAPVLVKAGFRVLAIDLRGYGKSTGPGQKDVFTAPLHLDVLAAVRYLRTNGVKTVSLLGGSLGGGAAGDAVAHARPGEISRMATLAGFWSHKRGEDISVPLLVIVTRDDANADGLRLPAIQREFDKVPAKKELVVLEGKAHAQFMFDTPDSEKIMRMIIKFLKKH